MHCVRMFAVIACAALQCACVEVEVRVKSDGSIEHRTALKFPEEIAQEIARRPLPPGLAGRPGQPQTFEQACNAIGTPTRRNSVANSLPPEVVIETKIENGVANCIVTETIRNPERFNLQDGSALGLQLTGSKFKPIAGEDTYHFTYGGGMIEMLGMFGYPPDALSKTAALDIKLVGQSVAATDGKAGSDGKTAVWTFPLKQLLEKNPSATRPQGTATVRYK